MDVQVIGKYGAVIDAFVQTTINRLLMVGLGVVLLCALFALLLRGTAVIMWGDFAASDRFKSGETRHPSTFRSGFRQ